MASTLPLPNLDDRRWADLVEEGRALVPFYAPEWTDVNASDPGITLMELFAWIAEMDLYSVNRITDAARRKLLALAGVVSAPPRAAETILQLGLAPTATPLALPAEIEFAGHDPLGSEVRFRSRHALTPRPGSIGAVATTTGAARRDLTVAWRAGEAITPFGTDPDVSSALWIGLDIAPVAWNDATSLSLGIAVDEAERALSRDELDPRHHDVRLAWELSTGPGHWRQLADGDTVVDGTRALTLDGRVVVSLAGGQPVALADNEPARVWLRARIARGRYDAAPILRGLMFNAVEVVQSVPAEADAAIRGTGAPNQTIEIDGAPLVSESLRVASDEDGQWRTWAARPDFDASTRADAHYVADPSAGTITLGDGEHGRTARAGSAIAVAVDLTRAEAGNLAKDSIDSIADSHHNRTALTNLVDVQAQFAEITNPVAAAGGAAAESLDATVARARDERERAVRAVTLEDHVALAMATPGVRLARAEARANFHPGFPCLTAPGIVTVLVLPFLPADRPLPSVGLRHAVATYLERRRIVGSRIEIAGPEYVTVTVRASVAAIPGARPAEVQAAISRALDGFFHPLHGGPDGTGWPFGRGVYRSEVMQVIDGVPGVAHVVALELADAGGPTCGNLCIGPNGLVDAGAYEIDVR